MAVGEFARHLAQHRAHQGRYFIHLHGAIEHPAELVPLIQERALDRSPLRICFADPVKKTNLPLLKIPLVVPLECATALYRRNAGRRRIAPASKSPALRSDATKKRADGDCIVITYRR